MLSALVANLERDPTYLLGGYRPMALPAGGCAWVATSRRAAKGGRGCGRVQEQGARRAEGVHDTPKRGADQVGKNSAALCDVITQWYPPSSVTHRQTHKHVNPCSTPPGGGGAAPKRGRLPPCQGQGWHGATRINQARGSKQAPLSRARRHVASRPFTTKWGLRYSTPFRVSHVLVAPPMVAATDTMPRPCTLHTRGTTSAGHQGLRFMV